RPSPRKVSERNTKVCGQNVSRLRSQAFASSLRKDAANMAPLPARRPLPSQIKSAPVLLWPTRPVPARHPRPRCYGPSCPPERPRPDRGATRQTDEPHDRGRPRLVGPTGCVSAEATPAPVPAVGVRKTPSLRPLRGAAADLAKYRPGSVGRDRG